MSLDTESSCPDATLIHNKSKVGEVDMIEAFEFSAMSRSGEAATLVAFVQFDADAAPANGDADFLLGSIELFTWDGRAVKYDHGQLVSQDDSDTFTPKDDTILDLLAMQ